MNIMSLEIKTIVANFRSNQHIGTNPKPFHFHHLTIWKRKYGKCRHRQSWGYFYGSLWVTPFLLEDWSLEEGWKLMEDVKLLGRKWNRSTTFCMNVFWCIGFGLCFPFQIQMGAFTLPLPPFFPTLTSCFYPRSETSPNTEPSMQNHELKKPFPCREKYIFEMNKCASSQRELKLPQQVASFKARIAWLYTIRAWNIVRKYPVRLNTEDRTDRDHRTWTPWWGCPTTLATKQLVHLNFKGNLKCCWIHKGIYIGGETKGCRTIPSLIKKGVKNRIEWSRMGRRY